MRRHTGTLGLLAAGLALGMMVQPFLTGAARAGQDTPADPAAPRAAAEAADAVEYNLFIPPANPKAEKIVAKLDELGARGWRLVGTTHNNGGTSAFIFMRPRR